jgi:hypothetical protein
MASWQEDVQEEERGHMVIKEARNQEGIRLTLFIATLSYMKQSTRTRPYPLLQIALIYSLGHMDPHYLTTPH